MTLVSKVMNITLVCYYCSYKFATADAFCSLPFMLYSIILYTSSVHAETSALFTIEAAQLQLATASSN